METSLRNVVDLPLTIETAPGFYRVPVFCRGWPLTRVFISPMTATFEEYKQSIDSMQDDHRFLRYGDVLEDGSIFKQFYNVKADQYVYRTDFNAFQMMSRRHREDGSKKGMKPSTVTRILCSYIGWLAVHLDGCGDPASSLLLHYLTSRPLGPENIPFMVETLNHHLQASPLPSHFQLGVNLSQIKSALNWVISDRCWTQYPQPRPSVLWQDKPWIKHLSATLKSTLETDIKDLV